MSERQVRIQDVAALAGVSVGSASRVLNRAANVTPEVRARVEQAMAQLKYAPSHTARALRSKSSRTIGCMFSEVTNPLYARAFRALEETFHAEGYMLLLAQGLNDVQREVETLRTFRARGMDAVICAPGHESAPELVDTMNAMSMPILLFDREVPGSRADALLFDHVNGVKTTCERLFGLGHERIALALWNAGSRPVRLRVDGYRAAYRSAGRASPELILRQPTPTSSVYDELLAMLDGPAPPTALLAVGTNILVTALRAIAKSGRRIPEDFSVVSIGNNDFAQLHVPAIATLQTDTELVASHARRLLLDRLTAADSRAPRHVLVPYELEERGSMGPVGRK